jgi:hypothetical protein
MDLLNITSTANLAAEQHGLTDKTRQSAAKADSQTGQGARSEAGITPARLYHTSRIRTELLDGTHGLNSQSAWDLMDDVTPRIANTHPLKLAELQAVVDRTLIPAAYV